MARTVAATRKIAYRHRLQDRNRGEYLRIMREANMPVPVEAELLPATKGLKTNKGSQQAMTIEVKEVIARCFYDIGGREKFAEWARNNRTDFYKLYSKLLPIQLQSKETKELIITITPDEAEL